MPPFMLKVLRSGDAAWTAYIYVFCPQDKAQSVQTGYKEEQQHFIQRAFYKKWSF